MGGFFHFGMWRGVGWFGLVRGLFWFWFGSVRFAAGFYLDLVFVLVQRLTGSTGGGKEGGKRREGSWFHFGSGVWFTVVWFGLVRFGIDLVGLGCAGLV